MIQQKTRIPLQASDGMSLSRSCFELGITVLLYVIALATLACSSSYYLTPAAIIVTALCTVRLFIIQHDCGHRTMFSSVKTNNTVGLLLSLLTLVPYHYWRKTHNHHHANSGLDGETTIGSIEMLTASAYRDCSPFEKLMYRMNRSPFFLLGIVPVVLFFILYRSPALTKKSGNFSPLLKKKDWQGYFYLNSAIIIFYGTLTYFFGMSFLYEYLITFYLAAVVGILLFYIQHNYEEAYLAKKESWNHSDAALKGSSLFLPPPVFGWFIGNIGYHHLHHLHPKIPFYRLGKVHRDNIELFSDVKVIRLKEIPTQFKFKLYDESGMITWKDYKNKYVKMVAQVE